MRNELPGGDAVVLAATNPQAGRFPEIYANHLALADYIRSWSDRMEPELSAVGRLSDRSFSEDDYLLQEILFNPYTHDQVSQIRSELKELLEIIDNRDADGMKNYLTKIRKNVKD